MSSGNAEFNVYPNRKSFDEKFTGVLYIQNNLTYFVLYFHSF